MRDNDCIAISKTTTRNNLFKLTNIVPFLTAWSKNVALSSTERYLVTAQQACKERIECSENLN